MKRIRKNTWKILLAIILAFVLALLYNKRTLGMAFHEIAGLALCGLFIIHKVLNWKWLKAVTLGLFARRTPARQRLLWILDFLMFCSFAYILASGILISKILFPATGGGNAFKMGHYAAAALALLLAGIHVGLHMSWIGQRMVFLKKLPSIARRGLAILLSVAVLVFGALQFTSTSYMQWLGNIPSIFGAEQTQPKGFGGMNVIDTDSATVDNATVTLTDTASRTNLSAQSDTSAPTNADTSITNATTSTAITNADTAPIAHTNALGGENGNGKGPRNGQGPHDGEGDGTSANVFSALFGCLSLLLAFAVLTTWVDGTFAALRRRKRLRAALHAIQEP